MNATLRELVLAVRYGDTSLVGESAGYIILGAADRASAIARRADLDSILLTGEGEVVVDAASCSEPESERSLRILLGSLLRLVRSPCPNLERVAERASGSGLDHLVTELEAALVPVNRKAARRSLSRLVRDARRSATRAHQRVPVEPVAWDSPEHSSGGAGWHAPQAEEHSSCGAGWHAPQAEEHSSGGAGWHAPQAEEHSSGDLGQYAPRMGDWEPPTPVVSSLLREVEADEGPFQSVLHQPLEDFDQAPTRLKAPVCELEPQQSPSMEMLGSWQEEISWEIPLIRRAPRVSKRSRHHTSQLLQRMRKPAQPSEELYRGLRALSSEESLPEAPSPEAPTAIEDRFVVGRE